MAYCYPFRMASGTATMLPIDAKRKRVLLGIRSKNAWVYPGKLSLAGGFMEARFTEEQDMPLMKQARQFVMNLLDWKLVADEYSEGENLEECAIRELNEEMKINVDISQLKMFSVRSNSRTDTRAHVINACYYFEMTDEQIEAATAGDDLEELVWHDIADFDLEITYQAMEARYDMAFNHFEVMIQGIAAWNKQKQYERLESENNHLSQLVTQLQNENYALNNEIARRDATISNLGWAVDDRQGGI